MLESIGGASLYVIAGRISGMGKVKLCSNGLSERWKDLLSPMFSLHLVGEHGLGDTIGIVSVDNSVCGIASWVICLQLMISSIVVFFFIC